MECDIFIGISIEQNKITIERYSWVNQRNLRTSWIITELLLFCWVWTIFKENSLNRCMASDIYFTYKYRDKNRQAKLEICWKLSKKGNGAWGQTFIH